MKKVLRIIGIVLGVVILFFAVINIIPPKKVVEKNVFVIEKGSRPMIAAHRGGKNLNPENTFKAFDYSIENFNIDIIELDLCMTKDEKLILNHNMNINSSTDVGEENYLVADHTLEEIQQFNFGYNFKDKDGNYPYRNLLEGVSDENKSQVLLENQLRVVTVDELFEKYSKTDIKYIMEIKDSGDKGLRAVDLLVGLMKKYNLVDKVVVGTFHDEVESYLCSDYPEILRGGSVGAVTQFVVTQLFKVNIFDNSSFACLQIPVEESAAGIKFNLTLKTYIRRAHRRNIAVQYWTINDKEEMRRLIKLGADCIMTDCPDVLYELLEEMGY